MLGVTIDRAIMRVEKVLSNDVLELEGHDRWILKDHSKNCILWHLPNFDGIVDLTLSVILSTLKYILCGRAQGVATMIFYSVSLIGWHMTYLIPPLDHLPIGQWICSQCEKRSRGS